MLMRDAESTVPHLADGEVVQALRHYVREGDIDASAAAVALDDFRALDLLDGILLTCDGPLSRAPGLADRVVLLDGENTNR